jgi:hypothetical protein
VFCRIGQFLVVCALVVSIGGHWAVLQSVAWMGMTVNFVQTDPLPEALRKTFDGQHPCGLCKVVAKGKQSEKKKDTQKPDTKLDFFLMGKKVILAEPPPFVHCSAEPDSARFRSDSPPTPPPRWA